MQIASLMISIIALAVSVTTAWLTLLRRGTVRMTQPTIIFFGPDGGSPDEGRGLPKIYLRTLLYATSKRGCIIESMFVRLTRGETSQNFNIWVYGEHKLLRGSGLHVGEDGVAYNHHFLLPADGTAFQFLRGDCVLDVYASLVGSGRTLKLFTVRLSLAEQIANRLRDSEAGVYFDWGPDSHGYHSHVREKPAEQLPILLLEGIKGPARSVGKRSNRKKGEAMGTERKPLANKPMPDPSI